jgi:YggT family protein
MFPMAILSWFRVQPGTTLARVQYFMHQATEPLLRPVRRVIRPMGGLDLSFIVVFLVLQYVVIRVLFSA